MQMLMKEEIGHFPMPLNALVGQAVKNQGSQLYVRRMSNVRGDSELECHRKC